MLVVRFQNIKKALIQVLSMRQQDRDAETRVYVEDRLVYAQYQDSKTVLLDLRGDERALFTALIHEMSPEA